MRLMTCVNCGYAMGPGERFCRNCGHDSVQVVQSAYVPAPKGRSWLFSACIVLPATLVGLAVVVWIVLILASRFL